MEGKKGRRREEGVECGEKRTIHCGVRRKAAEDDFYQAQRPWRGYRSQKCACILVTQPWSYRAAGCYGDFRETLCVSDCRISRSEHVMLTVGISPHWKRRQTKTEQSGSIFTFVVLKLCGSKLKPWTSLAPCRPADR